MKIVETIEGVIQDTLDKDAKTVLAQSGAEVQAYYQKWRGYLKSMDVCVADISFPSTVNVGFEVASLLNHGKPVVALYRKGEDPVFLSPEFASRMIKIEYEYETVEEVLRWALEEAEQWLSRRFTFFIDGKIESFLEERTKKKGESRSELIRGMIEQEMEKARE